MYRVSLVNMPFASGTMPSLALTQLKSVLEEHFKDQIDVDTAEYAQTTSRWLGPVREQLTLWVEKWWRPSHATIPKLFFKEERERTIIHDTRFGDAVAHDVGAAGRDLLKYLNKPKDLVDITRKFGHLAGFDAEREIGSLREK